MNNVLVDTNVLIYAIDEDSKYFNKSHQLISSSHVKLHTTSKNLTEFLAVTTRTSKNPLPLADALSVIDDFKSLLTVLYPTEKSYDILLNLLSKYQPAGLKIHDFEIVSIGLADQVEQIATFNTKDFASIREIHLYPL